MRSVFKNKFYGSAVIDEKGELVIPQELRIALNIRSGDRLMVLTNPGDKFISLISTDSFHKPLSKRPNRKKK